MIMIIIVIVVIIVAMITIVDTIIMLFNYQGSPSDQFKAIDENGDGAVSFDEWLSFAYKNYQVYFDGQLWR